MCTNKDVISLSRLARLCSSGLAISTSLTCMVIISTPGIQRFCGKNRELESEEAREKAHEYERKREGGREEGRGREIY